MNCIHQRQASSGWVDTQAWSRLSVSSEGNVVSCFLLQTLLLCIVHVIVCGMTFPLAVMATVSILQGNCSLVSSCPSQRSFLPPCSPPLPFPARSKAIEYLIDFTHCSGNSSVGWWRPLVMAAKSICCELADDTSHDSTPSRPSCSLLQDKAWQPGLNEIIRDLKPVLTWSSCNVYHREAYFCTFWLSLCMWNGGLGEGHG